MGVKEMKEIAAITRLVLSRSKPETTASGSQAGTPSKAKYTVDPGALAEGKSRVQKLLSDFPVYPNLDLGLLEKHFGAA